MTDEIKSRSKSSVLPKLLDDQQTQELVEWSAVLADASRKLDRALGLMRTGYDQRASENVALAIAAVESAKRCLQGLKPS